MSAARARWWGGGVRVCVCVCVGVCVGVAGQTLPCESVLYTLRKRHPLSLPLQPLYLQAGTPTLAPAPTRAHILTHTRAPPKSQASSSHLAAVSDVGELQGLLDETVRGDPALLDRALAEIVEAGDSELCRFGVCACGWVCVCVRVHVYMLRGGIMCRGIKAEVPARYRNTRRYLQTLWLQMCPRNLANRNGSVGVHVSPGSCLQQTRCPSHEHIRRSSMSFCASATASAMHFLTCGGLWARTRGKENLRLN